MFVFRGRVWKFFLKKVEGETRWNFPARFGGSTQLWFFHLNKQSLWIFEVSVGNPKKKRSSPSFRIMKFDPVQNVWEDHSWMPQGLYVSVLKNFDPYKSCMVFWVIGTINDPWKQLIDTWGVFGICASLEGLWKTSQQLCAGVGFRRVGAKKKVELVWVFQSCLVPKCGSLHLWRTSEVKIFPNFPPHVLYGLSLHSRGDHHHNHDHKRRTKSLVLRSRFPVCWKIRACRVVTVWAKTSAAWDGQRRFPWYDVHVPGEVLVGGGWVEGINGWAENWR